MPLILRLYSSEKEFYTEKQSFSLSLFENSFIEFAS